MFRGKGKNGKKGKRDKKAMKKPQTIDLRKKHSIFGLKSKKEINSDDSLRCIICNTKITDNPIFCNQYLTRTRLCNAGPFCSDECTQKHLENTTHY